MSGGSPSRRRGACHPRACHRWPATSDRAGRHPPALHCAADSFGTGCLVLGTDFPYETGAVFERAVSYITTSGLAPGDAGRVLSVNAEALRSWRIRDRLVLDE